MPPQETSETTVQGKTTDLGASCEFVTPGSFSPCGLVIFGASGDLTARKLIPAFYSLHLTDSLPESFTIVGCSRTRLTNDEFREKLKQDIIKIGAMDTARWDSFAAKLFYQPITYDARESYLELADFLRDL